LKIYCSAFLEEIGGKMQHNAFVHKNKKAPPKPAELKGHGLKRIGKRVITPLLIV
jgi:hypothetical protein